MAEGAGLLNRKQFFPHLTPCDFSLFHGAIVTALSTVCDTKLHDLTPRNGERDAKRYATDSDNIVGVGGGRDYE